MMAPTAPGMVRRLPAVVCALLVLCACGCATSGFAATTAPSARDTASAPDGRLAAPAGRRINCNRVVLQAVAAMSRGGRYEASSAALTSLAGAVSADGRRLDIRPRDASPNFCSGGTYLVFLKVIERLRREGRIRLTSETAQSLLVHGQDDGEGVWGRWNANGPGTARLFFELGLGRNFDDWRRARPGDFMKIWWTDQIGSRERGHSVVFLGTGRDREGTQTVTFWSSNKPDGFGRLTIPRERVKRVLFSRLEFPGRIANAPALPTLDRYLADMLRRPGTPEEMAELTGTGAGTKTRQDD